MKFNIHIYFNLKLRFQTFTCEWNKQLISRWTLKYIIKHFCLFMYSVKYLFKIFYKVCRAFDEKNNYTVIFFFIHIYQFYFLCILKKNFLKWKRQIINFYWPTQIILCLLRFAERNGGIYISISENSISKDLKI